MKKAGKIQQLDALKPKPEERRKRYSDAEVLGIIRTYQRGVPIMEIAKVLGANRANLYSVVGAWALRHCRCHAAGKR